MIDKLSCVIRDYEWGDLTAIPAMLGVEPDGKPQAEMWIGAHPGAPSALASTGQGLDLAIAQNPERLLGKGLAFAKPGSITRPVELPYLVKFLAAAQPLSIQVHPDAQRALAGFHEENSLDIGRGEPRRTYRDRNHKPELVVALSRFSTLCGFREVSDTIAILGSLRVLELSELIGRLESNPLAETVEWILKLDAGQVATLIKQLIASALPAELGWVTAVAARYPDDAGLLVGLLLNHVVLKPGEGLFLEAGNLHSYLGGLAIEVMANSDNVIRGGLTKKHVDIAELLAVTSFRAIAPPVQKPSTSSFRYEAGVSEFGLVRLVLEASMVEVRTAGPEILVLSEGTVELTSNDGFGLSLIQGEAAFVGADESSYRVSGTGVLWRATTG